MSIAAPSWTSLQNGAALAQPVSNVPSNQPLDLHDVLLDTVGAESWVRFRFLAPEIGGRDGARSFAEVEADFEHLCTAIALPYLRDFELEADIVAVTLFDRPVEFGATDPDATQYVEVFRVSSGACIWEGL